MAAFALLTAAEYFTIDDASETKHELVDGVIDAMAGGTPTTLVCPPGSSAFLVLGFEVKGASLTVAISG